MKPIFIFLSAFLITLAFASLHAADVNDLTYNVGENFVSITGCDTAASGALVIPDSIEGKPVTRIGTAAFSDCTGLTGVTIPGSVSHIYAQAFSSCTGLTSMTIPSGVTFVGNSSFAGCTGLSAISIPDNVTSIGIAAFYECTGLTSLTIGNGVTSIEQYTFYGCSALTEIIIPDNVTEIETYAFRFCSSVKNVTIGNGVSSIGNRAFHGCPLDTLTIGSGITYIDDYAFIGLSALHRIDEVIFLGNDAPATGTNVFGSSPPFSITVPTYATGWGVYRDTFEGALLTSLAPFTYTTQNGAVTISGSSDLYSGPVYIPPQIYGNPVTAIANSCFNNRHRISGISLPSSIASIGGLAFAKTNIPSVVIPEGITSIPVNAFRQCSQLARVTLPGNLESIEGYSFLGVDIVDITIPATVTDIGNKAFNGCNELSSIIFLGDAPSLGTDVFLVVAADAVIYYLPSKSGFTNLLSGIPTQSMLTYVVGGNSVTITGCITEVSGKLVIPDTIEGKPVTGIGDEAFRDCAKLKGVTIPGSVTSIGEHAFYGCSDLRIVNLEGNLPDTIAFDAFENSPYVIVVSSDANAGTAIGGAPVMDVAAMGLHRPEEVAAKDAEIATQAAQITELSQRPTLAEMQDARVGSIVLAKDDQSGEISLCFGLQKTDDFVTWEAFEGGTWSDAPDGEFKLTLPLGESKKWLRFTVPE